MMQTQKIKLSLITDKPYSQRSKDIASEDIYNSLPEAYKRVTTIQIVYNKSDLRLKNPLVLKLSTHNCNLSMPYLGKETVSFLLREYENEDVKEQTIIPHGFPMTKIIMASTVCCMGAGYCFGIKKEGYAFIFLAIFLLYSKYITENTLNNYYQKDNNYNDDIRFHTAE
jgi:hypothetical protein